MRFLTFAIGLGVALSLASATCIRAQNNDGGRYAAWKNGPSNDPSYFPIGVWLQSPSNAPKFKAAGVNFYVGLWQGPTEAQLAELKANDMRVICDLNAVGSRHLDDPTIMGWMHNDEPDNAQARAGGGYGPPVAPQKIIDDYHALQMRDPSRPIFLNLGQGVANDEWRGRGSEGKPEDYLGYVQGADILSYDVYPVAGIQKRDGENYLWYVAKGVDRLKTWSKGEKIIWNILECTNIGSTRKATPHQVRAEAWMSVVHGSRGLVWFVHRFQPTFSEAALLEDAEMLAGVTRVNNEIQSLASAINGRPVRRPATVVSSNAEAPIDAATWRGGGRRVIVAVGMRNGETTGSFTVPGIESATATVLGEDRTVSIRDGKFTDEFKPYDVHIYELR